MTKKKLSINIDDENRRMRFILAMKHFFKKEMGGETFQVAMRECDLIEFAFKGNGSVRFKRYDLDNIK